MGLVTYVHRRLVHRPSAAHGVDGRVPISVLGVGGRYQARSSAAWASSTTARSTRLSCSETQHRPGARVTAHGLHQVSGGGHCSSWPVDITLIGQRRHCTARDRSSGSGARTATNRSCGRDGSMPPGLRTSPRPVRGANLVTSCRAVPGAFRRDGRRPFGGPATSRSDRRAPAGPFSRPRRSASLRPVRRLRLASGRRAEAMLRPRGPVDAGERSVRRCPGGGGSVDMFHVKPAGAGHASYTGSRRRHDPTRAVGATVAALLPTHVSDPSVNLWSPSQTQAPANRGSTSSVAPPQRRGADRRTTEGRARWTDGAAFGSVPPVRLLYADHAQPGAYGWTNAVDESRR